MESRGIVRAAEQLVTESGRSAARRTKDRAVYRLTPHALLDESLPLTEFEARRCVGRLEAAR
jgi:hypothetical protein